jgi:hypothetical protein
LNPLPCNQRDDSRKRGGSHKAGRAGSIPAVATIWVWLNLAEHRLREPGIGGSNPPTQTILAGEALASLALLWVWLNLVEHRLGEPGTGGSNPSTQTTRDERAGERTGITNRPRRVRSPGPVPCRRSPIGRRLPPQKRFSVGSTPSAGTSRAWPWRAPASYIRHARVRSPARGPARPRGRMVRYLGFLIRSPLRVRLTATPPLRGSLSGESTGATSRIR